MLTLVDIDVLMYKEHPGTMKKINLFKCSQFEKKSNKCKIVNKNRQNRYKMFSK